MEFLELFLVKEEKYQAFTLINNNIFVNSIIMSSLNRL